MVTDNLEEQAVALRLRHSAFAPSALGDGSLYCKDCGFSVQVIIADKIECLSADRSAPKLPSAEIHIAGFERIKELGHGPLVPGKINDGSIICERCEVAVVDIVSHDMPCPKEVESLGHTMEKSKVIGEPGFFCGRCNGECAILVSNGTVCPNPLSSGESAETDASPDSPDQKSPADGALASDVELTFGNGEGLKMNTAQPPTPTIKTEGTVLTAEELLELERADHASELAMVRLQLADARYRELERTAKVMAAQFEVICKKMGIDPRKNFNVDKDRKLIYEKPPDPNMIPIGDVMSQRLGEEKAKQ